MILGPPPEKVRSFHPSKLTSKDLTAPPPLRKSRKHRPAPLDLSPSSNHLSPLDSNNPNALEDYLFSPSPMSSKSAVDMGMPSPAHYGQTDLLNILESNPPLTPVPPLQTATFRKDSGERDLDMSLRVDTPEGTAPSSPGLPPASHSTDVMEGPIDEIFLELLHTEQSFYLNWRPSR